MLATSILINKDLKQLLNILKALWIGLSCSSLLSVILIFDLHLNCITK